MIKAGTPAGGKTHGAGRLTEEDLISTLPAASSSREVRVGIFVLLGVVTFFVLLFTMTDVGTFRGRYNAVTIVEDAGGVRRGDPVQMRGVNIGRVIRFGMVPGGVAVTMELSNDYAVPTDSRVMVRSSGLLGGMVAEIIPGESEQRLRNGDVLPGDSEGTLVGALEGIGDQADDVLGRMQRLLSDGTLGAVDQGTAEARAVLAQLGGLATEQRREMAQLTSSLRRTATELEGATSQAQLGESLARMDAITRQLDVTTASLGRSTAALEVVLGRIQRGEGTLGRLSQDDALYENLNAAAVNMSALMDDVRADPRRYFSVRVF
jgi:phospholipid/cholesterol/gamma-HCH transport system substrate-binding protein